MLTNRQREKVAQLHERISDLEAELATAKKVIAARKDAIRFHMKRWADRFQRAKEEFALRKKAEAERDAAQSGYINAANAERALRSDNARLRDKLNESEGTEEAAVNRMWRLRDAVDFYANPEHWRDGECYCGTGRDEGAIARAALAQGEGKPKVRRLARHQPCGCVVCICEDDEQCHGCGAKNCGTHSPGEIPNPVYEDEQTQAGGGE